MRAHARQHPWKRPIQSKGKTASRRFEWIAIIIVSISRIRLGGGRASGQVGVLGRWGLTAAVAALLLHKLLLERLSLQVFALELCGTVI